MSTVLHSQEARCHLIVRHLSYFSNRACEKQNPLTEVINGYWVQLSLVEGDFWLLVVT